jgi:hypothetical protein
LDMLSRFSCLELLFCAIPESASAGICGVRE